MIITNDNNDNIKNKNSNKRRKKFKSGLAYFHSELRKVMFHQ